jgi:hypothetical protein
MQERETNSRSCFFDSPEFFSGRLAIACDSHRTRVGYST